MAAVSPTAQPHMSLASFPPEVQQALAPFDTDNNGTIGPEELAAAAKLYAASKKQEKRLRAIVVLVSVVFSIILLLQFGIMYGAIQLAKDSKISSAGGQAVMRSVDGSSVVQVASSDFFVGADGTLKLRTPPTSSTAPSKRELAAAFSARELADSAPNALSVGLAEKSAPLSSQMPDDAFAVLNRITLSSPTGVTMQLNIHGFIRQPGSWCKLGPVDLLTHVGRVVLIDDTLSYVDDAQYGYFSASGFPAVRPGSRKLQIMSLFGVFNAVISNARLAQASCESGQDAAAPHPPALPENFVMHAQRNSPCIPIPAGAQGMRNGNLPGAFDGSAVRPFGPGVDACALLNIPEEHLSYAYGDSGNITERFVPMSLTMYRHGNTRLRVEYSHPLYPDFTLVEVMDTSDPREIKSIRYQTADGERRGWEDVSAWDAATNSSSAQSQLVGPLYYFQTKNVTALDLARLATDNRMEFLGYTSLNGETVRLWAISLNNNTATAYWYDSVYDFSVVRISIPPFADLDVLSVEQIPPFSAKAHGHWYATPGPYTLFPQNMGSNSSMALKVGRISLDPFLPYSQSFVKREAQEARRRRALSKDTGHAAAPPPPPSPALITTRAAAFPKPAAAAMPLESPGALVLGAAPQRSNPLAPPTLARALIASTASCSATNKCVCRGGQCNTGFTPREFEFEFAGAGVKCAWGPPPNPVAQLLAGAAGSPSAPCDFTIAVSGPFLGNQFVTFEGTIGWTMCKNLKGFDTIYGALTLELDLTGGQDVGGLAKFLDIFNSRLIGIRIGKYSSYDSDVSGDYYPDCTYSTSARSIGFTSDSASALLGNMKSVLGFNKAKEACQCFSENQDFAQIGFSLEFLELHGVTLLPLFTPFPILAPLAFAIRMGSQFDFYWAPSTCAELARTDTSFLLYIQIDLVFFSWEKAVWNPITTKYKYDSDVMGQKTWGVRRLGHDKGGAFEATDHLARLLPASAEKKASMRAMADAHEHNAGEADDECKWAQKLWDGVSKIGSTISGWFKKKNKKARELGMIRDLAGALQHERNVLFPLSSKPLERIRRRALTQRQ